MNLLYNPNFILIILFICYCYYYYNSLFIALESKYCANFDNYSSYFHASIDCLLSRRNLKKVQSSQKNIYDEDLNQYAKYLQIDNDRIIHSMRQDFFIRKYDFITKTHIEKTKNIKYFVDLLVQDEYESILLLLLQSINSDI